MVVFAIELAQFGREAVAHLDHDVFAAAEHRVVEHVPPVFGDKDQMGVERGNNVSPATVFGGVGHGPDDNVFDSGS
ncbi:hypothetical protein GCM10010140_01010 [Streptosporangium pseudovulgare]|uniref:Uncharacterized protein n=1 Tax=Streptosporangium pseudovulgare TaxID=35765 RepID=A0ABQ2QDF0_9ACTN|nr:hypothetical protein GCM10010140_01010 [Streptosporangium pseudovulgare]